ncbi:MAG: thioredoxin family protein [Planctomycetota bacterium]
MTNTIAVVCLIAACLLLTSCASDGPARTVSSDAEPPERIRAWMDTLTISHHYDPETGFIVADEVTGLPDVFVTGDAIEAAVARARAAGKRVVIVATADRCAPCQQYKLDALNDREVIARLEQGDTVAAHLEVDRQPELARELVGSLGIPMTYELGTDGPVRTLRGQRPAADLLEFLG